MRLHEILVPPDGKRKGNLSGRVKRSGASCKGSATSSRAKAKKTGEKAKCIIGVLI